jgi:ABC-type phosphate transport system substrate-binding protein
MARRIVAGALLAVVMSLTLASASSAQTGPTGPTGPGTGGTTTTISSAGSTTARTGAEMWIPLVFGGGVIGAALVARSLARARSIS